MWSASQSVNSLQNYWKHGASFGACKKVRNLVSEGSKIDFIVWISSLNTNSRKMKAYENFFLKLVVLKCTTHFLLFKRDL